METNKVSKYVRVLNDSLKARLLGLVNVENHFLGKLDIIWFSLTEEEKCRAEAAAKILYNYHESQK